MLLGKKYRTDELFLFKSSEVKCKKVYDLKLSDKSAHYIVFSCLFICLKHYEINILEKEIKDKIDEDSELLKNCNQFLCLSYKCSIYFLCFASDFANIG